MQKNSYDPHGDLDIENRRRRLKFRAWHRGIKELDLIFGNFIEANMDSFDAEDCAWFERLFEEQDHEILGWVTKGEDVPKAFQGPMMDRLKKLDFMTLKAR
ncbi:succinate dehydrogenase assembly factor 2 [Kordiimonas sp.]|uniref:FAD assembly factor SdhE n=1 Tax=Kordiimonas sp. TaxID=1970157 RepID=UPI003A9010AB